MAGTPVEPTAETIVAILSDALPSIAISGTPRQFPKGFSRQSWRVATFAGALVVKIRRQPTDRAKLRSQVAAAHLAWAAGVPTAEVLYADLAPIVDDRPVVIVRYIPGVDAEEALPELTGPQREQFFASFGAAVGRMHRICLPHFTERIGSPEAAIRDWATTIRQNADRYAAWNARVGVLTSAEIAATKARLIAGAAAVSGCVRPALTHRDLYLPNIVVNEGRFAAIIDFEVAKGYDPLLDFTKLGAFVFASWPDGLPPFMNAYRAASELPEAATDRLVLCFALEQFVQVPNWAEAQQTDLLRDACRRLRGWLDGTYPWWLREIAAALS